MCRNGAGQPASTTRPKVSRSILILASTPDRAAVFIDGVQKGTTPFLAPVKAGLHDVVLKLAGRGDAASSFEMPSDRDLSLRITLPEVPKNAAPRLIIYSKPDGAALKIDEVDSGVTPWSGEIAEGKHKISISADGYLPESREVEAIKNREGDVSFLLQRRPGPAKLTVETEPADGVEISIDGAVVGTTPLAQAITLEPGEHQLQAAKATFRTLAQTVTAEQGASIAVKLSLSPAPKDPLPPTIALNTEPASALVRSWVAYSYYVEGQLDSAIIENRRAFQSDSTNLTTLSLGALILLNAHDVTGARNYIRRVSPRFHLAFYVLGADGDSVIAKARLRELEQQRAAPWLVEVSRAFYFLGARDSAQAITAFERATDAHGIWPATEAIEDPIFDPVRSNPRFQRVLRRVGLRSAPSSVNK